MRRGRAKDKERKETEEQQTTGYRRALATRNEIKLKKSKKSHTEGEMKGKKKKKSARERGRRLSDRC